MYCASLHGATPSKHTVIITVEFEDKGVRALFAVVLNGEDGKEAQVFVVVADKERNGQHNNYSVGEMLTNHQALKVRTPGRSLP